MRNNILEQTVIRKLIPADIDNIATIIRSVDNLWKVELSSKEKELSIEKYRQKLELEKFECVGVFYDGKLIIESSAFFPENAPMWYVMSLRSQILDDTLYGGKIQQELFRQCLYEFMQRGESAGCYTFYSCRSARHQNIINRMWERCNPDSTLRRYEYYLETYYKAGTPCKYLRHQIMFPESLTHPVDTVIYMHSLKQNYRMELETPIDK